MTTTAPGRPETLPDEHHDPEDGSKPRRAHRATASDQLSWRPGPLGRLRLWGRAAWWSPAWLTRVLPDIRFSHS